MLDEFEKIIGQAQDDSEADFYNDESQDADFNYENQNHEVAGYENEYDYVNNNNEPEQSKAENLDLEQNYERDYTTLDNASADIK